MGLQLLSALIPIGAAIFGPAIAAKFGATGATGETASKLVGKKTDPSTLVGSFLEMRGMVDSKGKATLTPRESIEIPRARSVQELTRGSPRGVNLAATSPVQRILQSDSRLEEAALRMMTQSTNAEMNRFVDKYAPQRTIPQGRKTVAAPQPRDIDVRIGQL